MQTAAPPYDPSNVFARILRGELPCHKIYEDENTFAFMDIMPRSGGHVLVIPKAPSRNILDAAPEDLAHVMAAAQKIARAAMEAFDAQGITIVQSSERAAEQVVFHFHMHVLPRYDGAALKPPGQKGDDAGIAGDAAKLREALATLP